MVAFVQKCFVCPVKIANEHIPVDSDPVAYINKLSEHHIASDFWGDSKQYRKNYSSQKIIIEGTKDKFSEKKAHIWKKGERKDLLSTFA